MDFHTSVSLIWAESWLTDNRPNFLSNDSVLIRSLVLDPFIALSILFWVSWSAFIGPLLEVSVFVFTFMQSWRPYRILLTHRLCTMVISLSEGICRFILLITNNLRFSADFSCLKCWFQSWDSAIIIPSNFADSDLSTRVSPTLICRRAVSFLFLSFRTINSVLSLLATRPFDAM